MWKRAALVLVPVAVLLGACTSDVESPPDDSIEEAVGAGSSCDSVRVILSRLRRKLGDPPLIETVTGAGYRFVTVGPEEEGEGEHGPSCSHRPTWPPSCRTRSTTTSRPARWR